MLTSFLYFSFSRSETRFCVRFQPGFVCSDDLSADSLKCLLVCSQVFVSFLLIYLFLGQFDAQHFQEKSQSSILFF